MARTEQRALKQLADQRGLSVASLARESIALYGSVLRAKEDDHRAPLAQICLAAGVPLPKAVRLLAGLATSLGEPDATIRGKRDRRQ